jgi:hypothetical protein
MESDQCDSGNGSFSNTYNNPTSTSITGSISFTGCTRAGQTLNGQLSYSLDWTDPSGPYTTNITGNVTAEYNNNMTAIGNLNYTVTGNNATGDFTVNPFTHTVDYSGGHGFAVSLPDPVMGNVNTDDQAPSTLPERTAHRLKQPSTIRISTSKLTTAVGRSLRSVPFPVLIYSRSTDHSCCDISESVERVYGKSK